MNDNERFELIKRFALEIMQWELSHDGIEYCSFSDKDGNIRRVYKQFPRSVTKSWNPFEHEADAFELERATIGLLKAQKAEPFIELEHIIDDDKDEYTCTIGYDYSEARVITEMSEYATVAEAICAAVQHFVDTYLT